MLTHKTKKTTSKLVNWHWLFVFFSVFSWFCKIFKLAIGFFWFFWHWFWPKFEIENCFLVSIKFQIEVKGKPADYFLSDTDRIWLGFGFSTYGMWLD